MHKSLLLTIVFLSAGLPEVSRGTGALSRELVETLARVAPSERQYQWQAMEFTAFLHFGINTFTDREWGTGSENPADFRPTALDTDQWCRFLSENGFKLAILTVKHHEGFCLWPTRYTRHSVAGSPWRDGQGDVVAEFARSCRKYGLKMGIYLSPADLYQMESPAGFGSGLYGNGSAPRQVTIPTPVPGARPVPEGHRFTVEVDDYNAYFLNQLYELLTEYGEVGEIWFDGAHPARKGGQKYRTDLWAEVIRALQPDIVIHGNGFNEIRWVGNELGFARDEEWSVIPARFAATYPWKEEDLGSRRRIEALGEREFLWLPAETCVSIRPGWFYHASQDHAVKPPEHLFKIYLESIGRNSTLLLNFPPDRRGLIHETDIRNTEAFRSRLQAALATNFAAGARIMASHSQAGHPPENLLDDDPATYWATQPGQESATLELQFRKAATFNLVILQEHVQSGQRVEAFTVYGMKDGTWCELGGGSTIGYKRILHLPQPFTTDRVQVKIGQSRYALTLATFSLHRYRDSVVAPEFDVREGKIAIGLPTKRVFRSKGRAIESAVETKGYQIRFTTNGVEVASSSPIYRTPFHMMSGRVLAKSYVEEAGELRESGTSVLDVCYPREFVEALAKPAAAGEPLVLKLREPRAICGFRYTPGDGKKMPLISEYSLQISEDNATWQTVYALDRFDNIENDPTARMRRFPAVRGRYVKLTPRASVNRAYDIRPTQVDIFIQ